MGGDSCSALNLKKKEQLIGKRYPTPNSLAEAHRKAVNPGENHWKVN